MRFGPDVGKEDKAGREGEGKGCSKYPRSVSINTRRLSIPSLKCHRYLRYVKPSYDNFVRPTSSHADIVSSMLSNSRLLADGRR
jgi:hypothetical protein